jgi:hypothetical protein
MKATEQIKPKEAPKATPKEERPPGNVSEIAKQVDILEEQSLTKRQMDAVHEIRNILGIAPESPEIDHELPEPEVPPVREEEAKAPVVREEHHGRHSTR